MKIIRFTKICAHMGNGATKSSLAHTNAKAKTIVKGKMERGRERKREKFAFSLNGKLPVIILSWWFVIAIAVRVLCKDFCG